jgi:peptide deformylase
MSIREVIQIGDDRLKCENKTLSPANKELARKLVHDLKDTMLENDIVGIAAPQIGENYRIFITEPRETAYRKGNQVDGLRVFINPKIVIFSRDKTTIFEGCGSVGKNFFGPVVRSKEIVIESYDENFNKFRLTCDGLLARVIQHEYDHLSG